MISHWHNEKRLGVIHIVAKAWQSPKCRNKFSRCIYGRCSQSNHITKHHGPPSTDADPWGQQFYLKAEITNHYLQSHKVVTINLPRSAWVHHLISNEHHLSNFFAYYYTSLYGEWHINVLYRIAKVLMSQSMTLHAKAWNVTLYTMISFIILNIIQYIKYTSCIMAMILQQNNSCSCI